jgi:TetR/AcrR family transcriptional regulator, transcriptional repressor for nem operon
MARSKEFDQEKALRKAVRLFSQQGFAATSTDELMRVMAVGRQSMYDTFGDKRELFLRALETYVTESVQSGVGEAWLGPLRCPKCSRDFC